MKHLWWTDTRMDKKQGNRQKEREWGDSGADRRTQTETMKCGGNGERQINREREKERERQWSIREADCGVDRTALLFGWESLSFYDTDELYISVWGPDMTYDRHNSFVFALSPSHDFSLTKMQRWHLFPFLCVIYWSLYVASPCECVTSTTKAQFTT